jgi:hypothetical protein
MVDFLLERFGLSRWCPRRRITAVGGCTQFLTRRWLCHAVVPHGSGCRSGSRNFNRRDGDVGGEQCCWQCIVAACEVVHVDPWTSNAHCRVVGWRWKLQFGEGLVGSLGLIDSIQAHWSEVSRKCDRHAGRWRHGKRCTRSEGRSSLSKTVAKRSTLQEILKTGKFYSARTNYQFDKEFSS